MSRMSIGVRDRPTHRSADHVDEGPVGGNLKFEAGSLQYYRGLSVWRRRARLGGGLGILGEELGMQPLAGAGLGAGRLHRGVQAPGPQQ